MLALTELCESQELWAVLHFFTCLPVFSCKSTCTCCASNRFFFNDIHVQCIFCMKFSVNSWLKKVKDKICSTYIFYFQVCSHHDRQDFRKAPRVFWATVERLRKYIWNLSNFKYIKAFGLVKILWKKLRSSWTKEEKREVFQPCLVIQIIG